MSYEELETVISNIRETLGETNSALVSEELIGIISAYRVLEDRIANHEEELENLRKENEELLKVNGRLFQKIGIEKEEKEELELEKEKEEEELDIDDIIDEKGELI